MQTERFELWEGDIPYYIGGERPTLTYYPVYPRSAKSGKGTVVICPGGGYSGRAPHEGRGYAEYLNSQGLDAFVLDYRVKPNVYPAALCDARRAIRFVRFNAEKFGIDPEKVAIMGSSAGGHLAAHASTFIGDIEGEAHDEIDKMDYVPNGQILCYPVISSDEAICHKGSYRNLLGEERYGERDKFSPDLLVSEKTPMAFIWHTMTDTGVLVSNSYRYAEALYKNGIKHELHVFPVGEHGQALGAHVAYVREWTELLRRWLVLNNFLNG